VAGYLLGIEPSTESVALHDVCDRLARQPCGADVAVTVNRAEGGPLSDPGCVDPGLPRSHRAGGRVRPEGDTYRASLAFLVSLGTAQSDREAMLSGNGVCGVECHQFGTGAARRLVINVKVPSWVDFPAQSPRWSEFHDLRDPNSGSDGGHFRVVRADDFYPALDLIMNLKLRVGGDPSRILSPGFIEVSVETEGLTPNGTRLFPSFAHKVGKERAEFWNSPDWPGEKYWRWYRSLPRRVHAIPKDHVRCGPGKRIDRRPIAAD
jgi:hypothetical protein